MKAAALYFRVSTEDQRDRQTIETQAGEVRRYCEQHAIPIHKEYADDGISGTVPFAERPAAARLLRDTGAGHFDTVLVYKLDRIGRDPLVTMLAVEALKKAGVAVQSTTQSFDAEDPTGRLLMTILSGVAGFERETIIQRSVAGTNRLAREGVWLGGIVPYGYRVEGQRSAARLALSLEPLPGFTLSEADVVRLIYRLAGEERLTYCKIAQHLNALGIPPPSVSRGQRRKPSPRPEAVTGLWRTVQVRSILQSTTYRGVHRFGKRTQKVREVIERPVPALVSEGDWSAAHQALRLNFHAYDRENRRPYLLRGLIYCQCGLRYSGGRHGNGSIPYYTCPGADNSRDRRNRVPCPGKTLRAEEIEQTVWADIEGFLHNPGAVLVELAQQLQAEARAVQATRADEDRLTEKIASKQQESDCVIALYRRGRISQAQLDRQLDNIEREEASLKAQREEARARGRAAEDAELQLHDAESLLLELQSRLAEPLSWDVKRQLIEALVKELRVQTTGEGAKRQAAVTITYAFGRVKDCTGSRADFYATLRRAVLMPGGAPGRAAASQ